MFGSLFESWLLQAEERAAIKSGKQPYFLKAAEKKRQALIQKYQQLKESGQLEKAMAKRRKKVAAKDHRLVPRSRRGPAFTVSSS